MRKFVKPAVKGASIPDPTHSRELPQDGIEVEWTPYWAGLEARGDITVNPVPAERNPDPEPPPAARKKS